MTYPYYKTIGECMDKGEQAGKDAWLAGLERKDNPHVPEDYVSRFYWNLGWELAEAEFKRGPRCEQEFSPSSSL